ncbi:MAG: BatA domain-containing protein, partial [Planctomycetota bacterium]
MTFLNGILLAGAAALAIPVLIHLFHKSRFRVVPWGAMHLLESVLRRNSRRVRLEQLLLLAVRASIPVVLALCMARPVLTGLAPLLGEARSSVVLLLDDSYSMEAGTGGRTNFQEAQDVAARILEQLPPGSEAAVVPLSGGARPLVEELTTDLERLRGELARLRGGFGSADVPGALAAA